MAVVAGFPRGIGLGEAPPFPNFRCRSYQGESQVFKLQQTNKKSDSLFPARVTLERIGEEIKLNAQRR